VRSASLDQSSLSSRARETVSRRVATSSVKAEAAPCTPLGGYPHPAMALQALRRRVPLVAFILIALLCLVLLGVACACMSDHPVQALEKALAAVAAHPALIEVWALLPLTLLGAWALLGPSPLPRAGGPSIASLQRFLL
jgi:hypothetical protein